MQQIDGTGTDSKNEKKRKVRGPDSPGFCRPGPCQILLTADYGQEQPLHPTEGEGERKRDKERERERDREREREKERERERSIERERERERETERKR